MPMKPENRPAWEIGLTGVTLYAGKEHHVRLWTPDLSGNAVTLKRWNWLSGGIAPSVLLDMSSSLLSEIEATILTVWGVQPDLLKPT
jgi:hypothetical protein